MRVHPLAGDIYHYALACASSDTLRMRAQASSSATSLTLLRDDENDEQEFTGSMDIQIAVNHDHDVAIEVSDDGESKTLITEDDTLLFLGYKSATRDASHITDPKTQLPLSMNQRVRDVIIVERTLSGTTLFEWNSWDHLNIPDCISGGFEERYVQINGFHLVNGDIVASFRNCGTVLRIDRSGGTGAVEWQVGGSSANPQTAFRPITGDDAAHNEFCAQHNPTQLGDKLVVFDNGNRCVGPRKADPVFSRVVAYDLSSGTEARFSREYRRRSGHGYARYEGGVTVLGNGNWLIFWGYPLGYTVGVDELVTISEVNPRGEVVFEMNMSGDGYPVSSYRVYRMPETEFKIPWNLP